MSGDGGLRQEVTCVVHDLSDRTAVVFDDARVVAHISAEIAGIPEQDWQPLSDSPDDGEAQIAQTMIGHQRSHHKTQTVDPG